MTDLSDDYRDIFFELRRLLSRYPRFTRRFGWTLLLIVSFVSGLGIKTVADTMTIGHEDYRLIPANRLIALNTLHDQALEAGAALPVAVRKTYPACGPESVIPSLEE